MRNVNIMETHVANTRKHIENNGNKMILIMDRIVISFIIIKTFLIQQAGMHVQRWFGDTPN